MGHIAAIKFAFSKFDELIIVIGSSQASYEPENPFTGGERLSMIKDSLNADSKIDCKKTLIIPIPDTNAHSTWTQVLIRWYHNMMQYLQIMILQATFSINETFLS